MAKKVVTVVRIQIEAGKATPAPPVGSSLGPHGINIMEFVKTYNERTAQMAGFVVPVEVTIYEDRTYSMVLRTPPAADLIKNALGIPAGSGTPGKTQVGVLSKEQLREIAERKMQDLNTTSIEAAMRVIAGTARSMGVSIEE